MSRYLEWSDHAQGQADFAEPQRWQVALETITRATAGTLDAGAARALLSLMLGLTADEAGWLLGRVPRAGESPLTVVG